MKKMLFGGMLALCVFIVGAYVVGAAAVNGSFEQGTSPGVFSTLTPGSTDIDDWSVDSGSVDYIGTYWQAAQGSRSIDLNGLAAGSVSQTVPTMAGFEYAATFYLSGNPDGRAPGDPLYSPDSKVVRVSAPGGADVDFTFDTAANGNTKADMKWEKRMYLFTATSPYTILTFASRIGGAFGPALDNVSVSIVRTAEITSPDENEIVFGNAHLSAYLADDDVDAIQWAMRQGTCAAGTNTVFGNVDGHSDAASIDTGNVEMQTFSFDADMTGMSGGMYCFIYNPVEDSGESNIRLTREFYVADGHIHGGGQLIDERDDPNMPYKISFGGEVYNVGSNYMGEWEVNFHNVSNDRLDKTKFHSTDITEINFYHGDSNTCTDAMNMTILGELNGVSGYRMIFRAGDFGSPNTADTVRLTLYGPNGLPVYDTDDGNVDGIVHDGDFQNESSCVGTARTGLDKGNITIDW